MKEQIKNLYYQGFWQEPRAEVFRVTEYLEGESRVLIPERQDLRNHSPTGFAWGYLGSGPAQLALAILADYLHDDRKALGLYHEFKEEVIARLDQEDITWEIERHQIEDFLRRMQQA